MTRYRKVIVILAYNDTVLVDGGKPHQLARLSISRIYRRNTNVFNIYTFMCMKIKEDILLNR
ncbi:hypothetical protein BLOT_000481 [Blomia tropicalis]|nr:hypothetical protein BLOT_000481 [Blomia tropicalis]